MLAIQICSIIFLIEKAGIINYVIKFNPTMHFAFSESISSSNLSITFVIFHLDVFTDINI